MPVEVVAFDVHGTLLHWPENRVHGLEIQRLLQRYGISISYQALEAARQAVFFLDATRREIHSHVDFLALQFERMGVSVSLDLIESIAAMQDARDGMVAYPDAIPAIRAAREAGKQTCAFTTLPRFMLGRDEDGAEILRLLDPYFSISTVGQVKGDPRFYTRISESIGVEPDRILAVGDDPICDCILPAEAGWRTVLLNRDNNKTVEEIGSIATIGSLGELAAFYR
ncbi:MAG: HAD family hydrolase [Phycisphaerae bacterium]